MASFGWIAGTHYCPHLSDATTASFACILGMPWASTTPQWDPANVPRLSQETCERDLQDWLSPWAAGKLTWQLLVGDGAAWTLMGVARQMTHAVDAKFEATLRAQCQARLRAYVAGHADAMGFQTAGSNSEVLTYPIASPGIALLPVHFSDAILGTSAVISVDRALIPANAKILAVPTFHFTEGSVGPGNAVRVIDPETAEVAYDGPGRTVDGQAMKFSGCVVNAIAKDACSDFEVVSPTPIVIRSRTPDRQVYATLSRKFSPLGMWLKALSQPPADPVDAQELCKMIVRLLGGGEDELRNGAVVGSIFEMTLAPAIYADIFGEGTHKDREIKAAEMLARLNTDVSAGAANVAALLGKFSSHLSQVGMATEAGLADKLAVLATAPGKASREDIELAQELYAAMEVQQLSARLIWACWLATVLPVVAPATTKAAALAAAGALISEVKAIFADTKDQSGPVLEDDVLRLLNGQIDYADTYWEVVHKDDDLRQGLAAGKAIFTPAIISRVNASASVAQILALEYDRALDLVVQAARESEPEADDPPLQLRYRAALNSPDESIRGCILALRLGIPRAGLTEWKQGHWITDFHAEAGSANGFGPVITSSGVPAVFCDTQGSTLSDGLEEQVTVYSGAPLFAAEPVDSGEASRVMPELFRGKATGSALPQLAFGACYEGLSGTIDNAGGIFEEVLREPGLPGNPVQVLAPALFKSPGAPGASPFRYLSRQAPDAPVFSGGTDFGIAADTMSAQLAGIGNEAHRAVVLYSGAGFDGSCTSQQLRILAPSVGPTFMTRWLNSDALVDLADVFRWPPLLGKTIAQVETLRKAAAAEAAPRTTAKRTQLGLTNPAVGSIEVGITWFFGDGKTDLPPPLRIDLKHLNGAGWLRDESFSLAVEQASTADPAARKFALAGGGIRIVIPRGMQAKVEARSIIAQTLVEGENARLSREALVNDRDPASRPYEFRAAHAEYVTREPAHVWIESLPEVPADVDLFNFDPDNLALVTPQSLSDPAQLQLAYVGSTPRRADWILAVKMEAKRWQWSGYPVQFPRDGTLASWLPLYAGTTDTMPTLPDARFATVMQGGEWLLKGLVMKPVALAERRPASHMGMVIKAIPRFAKLLSEATKERIGTTYVYSHVLGVPRPQGKRLAPPVWDEAIPLPQTMLADSNGKLSQAARANLLVLKNPLYDTADTAEFGGIAERLELDVVGTWHTPIGEPPIDESGPNPIFHKAPQNSEPAAHFELDAAFGLGYDRVVGGRPAQTGVLVRPSLTQGRWTLAKCRLRRMVLPELVLDSVLSTMQLAVLSLRQVDDGWIPEDVALLSNTAIPQVSMGSVAIQMPVSAEVFERAYVITWHKDRWAAATPTWRPLVHLYARSATVHEWKLKARLTPYQSADFNPLGSGNGAIQLQVPPSTTTCRLDVSDFTESRWLTFIGGFGQTVPPARDDLRVERASGDSYRVSMKAPGAVLPQLGAADALSSTLLLLFAPQADVMRGRVETEGGELVGVYVASNLTAGEREAKFDIAILPCKRKPDECKALVIQMQRHNVQSTDGYSIKANGWDDLVAGLFPKEEDNKEASLRLLPEYIGPMPVEP